MNKAQVIPVILCGGSGKRLWPLSRKSYPKQFLNLIDNSNFSLMQDTQKRLNNLKNFSSPIVICNEEHRFIVAEQMKQIHVKPRSIILEKDERNTAAAVALAALRVLKNNENPILMIFSADHIIIDIQNFSRSLESAIELAKKNNLVVFGVIPNYPDTGYGYIKSAKNLNPDILNGERIMKFIEKPSKDIAEKLIKDGRYTWNSGMFLFSANTILDEFQKFEPELLSHCKEAILKTKRELDFERVYAKAFLKCKSVSLDVAIMEKTNIGVVVPLAAGWTDVGDWGSLWEHYEKNIDGNVLNGNVFVKNVKNSFLRSESRLVVGLGLSNLIVVETGDAVLIANKDLAQNVKDVVEDLKKSNFPEASLKDIIYKPWGYYINIKTGENWKVKLINVSPQSSLSLQSHKYRSENWIVIKGTAKVYVDPNEKTLSENQSIYIPTGSKHKLSNPTNSPLILMEVQTGDHLREDDIERFEDA